MRFLEALKVGKVIESNLGKRYVVQELNVNWIGGRACSHVSSVSAQEIKGEWRVVK